MTISMEKKWCDTRLNVFVTYTGFYKAGTPVTQGQSCYLPWEGDADTSDDAAKVAAQDYFDAKYGVGSDKVLSARIHDRGAHAPIGEDAVNAIVSRA